MIILRQKQFGFSAIMVDNNQEKRFSYFRPPMPKDKTLKLLLHLEDELNTTENWLTCSGYDGSQDISDRKDIKDGLRARGDYITAFNLHSGYLVEDIKKKLKDPNLSPEEKSKLREELKRWTKSRQNFKNEYDKPFKRPT